MTDADVIVVGAGHNGLICASYLARAGFDTLVLESRPTVGGCTSTVSALGANFNIGASEHSVIRAMDVIEDLDLTAHGLRYLEADANSINVFYDDTEPWVHFHDPEQTIESLAASYPNQVDGYRRYLADAMPVAELALEMARTPPSLRRFAATAGRRGRATARLLNWDKRTANDVMADYFDDWRVSMPSISHAPTAWGLGPDMPGTGMAALNFASLHFMQQGRPRGGSGALGNAIRAAFEIAGGRVRCDSRVDHLIIRGGSIKGVRLSDGTELASDVVVTCCDPHRVFVDWIDKPPPAARRMVRRWHNRYIGEGSASKLDAVLTGLPRFKGADQIESRHPGLDVLNPLMTVSLRPDELATANRLREEGQVSEKPTLAISYPSVLDPEMSPGDGRHVLSLEIFFTPYSLPGGWSDSKEPERWLELWAGLMEPGALDLVESWRAMTPDRYEEELSLHLGSTPSYVGAPLDTFLGRPRETTRYRTPIPGLYLSGAATFPGSGVMGAPGRNTADVVTRDLRGPVGRRIRSLKRRRAQLQDR